jgi:hypothetical protein
MNLSEKQQPTQNRQEIQPAFSTPVNNKNKVIPVMLCLLFLVILSVVAFSVIKKSPSQKLVVSVAPTISEKFSFENIPPLDTQYTWKEVTGYAQKLAKEAITSDKNGKATVHALQGKEWITNMTVTNATQQMSLPNENLNLQQAGWSQESQEVMNGTLYPIVADGSYAGVHGYMRIQNSMVQVYMLSSEATNMKFNKTTGDTPPQPVYPYTRELRVFISEPTPISSLFANN